VRELDHDVAIGAGRDDVIALDRLARREWTRGITVLDRDRALHIDDLARRHARL